MGNVRPSWCPHPDCGFRRSAGDAFCGGVLPAPQDHLPATKCNDKRICIKDLDNGQVTDWMVNDSDLDWFRWVFDALDDKVTSWLSKVEGEGEKKE